jgi:hypothetical protein
VSPNETLIHDVYGKSLYYKQVAMLRMMLKPASYGFSQPYANCRLEQNGCQGQGQDDEQEGWQI